MPYKIATWNVNSLRVRLPHVLEWLSTNQPDLLALQEIKMPDEDFPTTEIHQAGYECIFSGQRTYNGMAILSKTKGTDIITSIPELEDPQRRVLGMTWEGMRIINLYVPNGESVGSPKYEYKLNWLKHLIEFLAKELVRYPKMLLMGDFNIAPEEQDVYDPKAWEGRVLFSNPERAAFQSILQLGFKDCFRLFPQPERAYSWWDYRMNAFKRGMGLRIDHFLISQALVSTCKSCSIDIMPRTWERPSDHAPVIVSLTP
jgi:exodeoxyribonuclease III